VVTALFALALATAVPLGVRLVARELGLTVDPRLSLVAVVPAIAALALMSGVAAGTLVLPWAAFSAGVFALASLDILRDGIPPRPRRLTGWVAAGFLVVGAASLLADRSGYPLLGFGPTIVLLTAVHFHVAGFVLTTAGLMTLPDRWRLPRALPIAAVVVGSPLTALGFLGLAIAGWIGAVLVAVGGLGIGLATVRDARQVTSGAIRMAQLVGGATLFVTMPLAVAFATGTTYGVPALDIPAMAATHGTLNVLGFAIPTMAAWTARGGR
jgi:hypothetical protein